jgi:hypothetical protein
MIPGSIAPLVLSTVRHAFTALLRHTNATAALLAWFHTTSSSAPSEMTLDDSDEADVDAPPEYLTQMLRTAARLADEIISCKARGDDCVQWHNAFMERYRLLTQTVLPPAGLRASDLISRGVVLGTTTSSALGRSDIPSLPTTGMSGHSMLQLVRTNTGSTRLQPVEELESDSDGEDGMPPVMSGLQLARTNSRYSKATQITSLLRSTQVALQPSGDTPISPHAPGGGSQTLKRIRSLIDARAAATVAIQNVAPHPSDNPVALHIKAVVEFLQASGAESTPDMLNQLVDSMAQQQARCVARMLAVHFIADGIDALSTRQMSARSLSSTEAMTKPCVYAPSNVLSGYWLHQFSSALRQPSDKSTTENKLHILAQTESVGPRMRAQLNRRYLALSSKLMSQCIVENDAVGALQVEFQ